MKDQGTSHKGLMAGFMRMVVLAGVVMTFKPGQTELLLMCIVVVAADHHVRIVVVGQVFQLGPQAFASIWAESS